MSPNKESNGNDIISSLNETPSEQRRSSEKFWKWTASVLAIIIGVGSIIGVMGQAFYVTRGEFTEKAQKDAVNEASFRQTLERLDKTLNRQEEAFTKLTDTVNGVKMDMARSEAVTIERSGRNSR